MSASHPTGQQFEISDGEHVVVVTEVGANLRSYRVGDRDVVTPFGEDEIPPASHGAVLLPWPNRLGDGTYEWDGQTYRLPLTEHEPRRTALHGLACWTRWTLVEHEPHRVTLALDLVPNPGYPWALHSEITYAVSHDGLEVTLTTRNDADADAPYGAGFHPWLSPGGAKLDECTLRVDATEHVTIDERLLPAGVEKATGEWDFTEHRSLEGVALDDAFVGITRNAKGLSWIELSAPDGRTAAVWTDESMDTWQVCTGDGLVNADRTGVAAEPMTCIADAFRTGDRLIRLAPGEEHSVRWGLVLR
ncbi:MAG: aldose 1-epimerase family protein [Actinomycetota bacterium]|nr:aldose 1-epimerase family protein [Actinomycetota bacterium]